MFSSQIQPRARVAFLSAATLSFLVPSLLATSYYVDSAAGNDSNSGTSSSASWKSLTKVNAKTYAAGDKILFKAGGSWTGQLYPKGSGASGNPIVIDQYGTGNLPAIAANGTKNNTVFLLNQSYWEINSLDISNKASSPGDYRGVEIIGQDFGTINHVYVRACYIHDVTGEVNWISGSGSAQTGVHFATGWDASKRTGGVVFEVKSTASTPVKTHFNDVLVEDCTIKNVSFGGIIFKQWDGSVHWGVRNSSTDTNWYPHTNVVVRGNYINQSGTSLGCNGIYVTDTKGATVESNIIAHAGTSGIETYYSDNITISKNEVYGTVKKAGGADSNGIDPDKGTTNIMVEYNYVHENGDGILLCEFVFGSATVRYNILQKNSRYSFYLHSNNSATASIYNNTVYVNSSSAELAYAPTSYINSHYQFRNNIFYTTVSGPGVSTGGNITYDSNCYFGFTAPSSDGNRVTSNPKLVNPGTGGSGSGSGNAFASLSGYKLQAGSPCLNTGLTISNNGGQDFFGTTLYNGVPDLGADER